jgi:hypothetical protein
MGRKLIVPDLECTEKKPESKFKNPREEYIYSEDPISIDMLAKKWAWKKNCSRFTLNQKSRHQYWKQVRKNFWDECAKKREEEFHKQIVTKDVEELVEASRRHKQLGQTMQGLFHTSIKKEKGKTYLIRSDGEEIPLKAGDVIRAGKEGFEIERKALGYTDQVVQISFAEDVMSQVFDIVCKYIDDPSVVRNIQADLDVIRKKHQEKLEEFKP